MPSTALAKEEFLPTGYELPKNGSGDYMKFEDGANKFRILSSPVLGWEYWNKLDGNNKPVRLKFTEDNRKIAAQKAMMNPDEKDQKSKHFWAMKVYNYKTSRVEVLEITQKTIQESIKALVQNDDWGSPVGRYDITVTRTGTAKDTSFNLAPSPHKPNSEEIEAALEEAFIDLEALFYDANPFSKNWRAEANVADEVSDVF